MSYGGAKSSSRLSITTFSPPGISSSYDDGAVADGPHARSPASDRSTRRSSKSASLSLADIVTILSAHVQPEFVHTDTDRVARRHKLHPQLSSHIPEVKIRPT